MYTLQSFLNKNPQLAEGVYIDPCARVIGEVTLGRDVSIWPFCSVRGDVNAISIGARSNIQDNSVCHVTHKHDANPDGYPLIIGCDVTIGHSVTVHACRIDDRCLVGMGCVLLDNCHLQPEVLVGAGSLVPPNKVLASGYLYHGRPAKQIRPLTTSERAHFCYSSAHYVKLKNQYLSQQPSD